MTTDNDNDNEPAVNEAVLLITKLMANSPGKSCGLLYQAIGWVVNYPLMATASE